jgi:hypothetical protein
VGGFVVLAASGAYAAVKLSQKDAERIEEHTGYPPDQLEDQDLQDAMQELNIDSQPLTEEEKAGLEGASPGAGGAPAGESSYLDELEKLGDLRDKGIITEDEFEAKKKQLLGL